MSDLGRLVERLSKHLFDSPVLPLSRADVRALLSAARELEALKGAMEEMRGWNPNETVCEEIKANAAAILAKKEKKRAEK